MSIVARRVLVVLFVVVVAALLGVVSASSTVAGYSYDDTSNSVHGGYDQVTSLAPDAVGETVRLARGLRPHDDAAAASLGDPGVIAAPEAIRGLQFADEAAQGFGSMSSFRRAYGSAGPNAQWHHIVEQHTGNVGRFGAESIHNTSNIIRLDTTIHRQVSGYYSSIQPFTGGQTVRQWLGTQPFDAQRQFGLDVLQRFGATG